jgi:DNA-binding MarR family transcriptional regulator
MRVSADPLKMCTQGVLENSNCMRDTTSLPNAPRAMSDDEKVIIKKALAFLAEFRKIRKTMPLQHAYSLLLVALEEGLGVQEYAQLADVAQSVMTRNLLDLGSRNRKREPGYGLVDQRMNPMNMREHQTFLTPDGRALVKRLIMTVK